MSALPPTVPINAEILRDLLVRRDELVSAITAGMASGEWDQVMAPFEGLMVAIKRLEEDVQTLRRQTT